MTTEREHTLDHDCWCNPTVMIFGDDSEQDISGEGDQESLGERVLRLEELVLLLVKHGPNQNTQPELDRKYMSRLEDLVNGRAGKVLR